MTYRSLMQCLTIVVIPRHQRDCPDSEDSDNPLGEPHVDVTKEQLQRMLERRIFTDLVPDLFGVRTNYNCGSDSDSEEILHSDNLSSLSTKVVNKLLYNHQNAYHGVNFTRETLQILLDRKIAATLYDDLKKNSSTKGCDVVKEVRGSDGKWKKLHVKPVNLAVSLDQSVAAQCDSLNVPITPVNASYSYTSYSSAVQAKASSPCGQPPSIFSPPLTPRNKYTEWTKDIATVVGTLSNIKRLFTRSKSASASRNRQEIFI